MQRNSLQLSDEKIRQNLDELQEKLGNNRLRLRAELTPESSYDSDCCTDETAYQTES